MSEFLRNMDNEIIPSERWQLLEDLFKKNYLKKIYKTQKIPKIIHQIWFGGELPESSKKLTDIVKKINSDYEYKLWTDADIAGFNLKNIDLFNNISNYGAKSDIFRYEVLERIGGIYLDIDFDCIKPFDDLLHLDFFAGNGHVDIAEIFNSIIASSPNNKIINSFVNGLSELKTFKDNIEGVMKNTGPYYIMKQFYDNTTLKDNAVIFPTKFFYPFPAEHRNKIRNYNKNAEDYAKSFINENTYCIHLWQTSWQKIN